MGIISKSPTIGTEDTKMDQSRPQDTSVGGGSRPVRSKIPIETSAPSDPHGLSRKPPGSLK
jgi:hypothetical protein